MSGRRRYRSRSRSKSPKYRRKKSPEFSTSRKTTRSRSPSERYCQSKAERPRSEGSRIIRLQNSPKKRHDTSEKSPEEIQMMNVMGFSNFSTNKRGFSPSPEFETPAKIERKEKIFTESKSSDQHDVTMEQTLTQENNKQDLNSTLDKYENALHLSNWVPNMKGKKMIVEGDLLDLKEVNPNGDGGNRWFTARVIDRIKPNLVITKGGPYCLEGEMNFQTALRYNTPQFVMQNFKTGFPENWEMFRDQWRKLIKQQRAVSDLSENLDDKKSTERTKKLNLEPTPELIVGLVLDDLIKQISEKSLDPGIPKHKKEMKNRNDDVRSNLKRLAKECDTYTPQKIKSHSPRSPPPPPIIRDWDRNSREINRSKDRDRSYKDGGRSRRQRSRSRDRRPRSEDIRNRNESPPLRRDSNRDSRDQDRSSRDRDRFAKESDSYTSRKIKSHSPRFSSSTRGWDRDSRDLNRSSRDRDRSFMDGDQSRRQRSRSRDQNPRSKDRHSRDRSQEKRSSSKEKRQQTPPPLDQGQENYDEIHTFFTSRIQNICKLSYGESRKVSDAMIEACKNTFPCPNRDLRAQYLRALEVERKKNNNNLPAASNANSAQDKDNNTWLLDFRRSLHSQLSQNVKHKQGHLYSFSEIVDLILSYLLEPVNTV